MINSFTSSPTIMRSLLKAVDQRFFGNILKRSSLRFFLLRKSRILSKAQVAEILFQIDVSRLRKGDIVIDCGCNVGQVTKALAQTGAIVHSFDPEPLVAPIMEEITKLYPNVEFHPVAVGVKNSRVKLFRPIHFEDDPVTWSVAVSTCAEKRRMNHSDTIEVDQIDLLEFLESLGEVKILKLDIEGAEIEILKMLFTSRAINKIKKIYVELHDEMIMPMLGEYAIIRRTVAEEFREKINVDWR